MGVAEILWRIILSILILGCSTSASNVSKPHESLEQVPVELAVKLVPEVEIDLKKKKEEQSKSVAGFFKTSLEVLNKEGKINFDFSLQNVSGKEQHISYGSGQKYDIFIYNAQNEEIYRWSINKAFTQALIVTTMKKDSKLVFNEQWNLKDNKGNIVPPGKYTIKVEVMIASNSEEIHQIHSDDLTARTVYEVN